MSEPTARWVVSPAEDGMRLDHFLHRRMPRMSRTRIQQAIRERVAVSWRETARPSTPVRAGGEIMIESKELNEVPLEIEIPILHRATGWLAVDKPSGLPVHPVSRVRDNTLIRILRKQEGNEDLRLAHRLDAETSGVLLIACHADAARHLGRQFVRGTVGKTYVAVLKGCPEASEGTIDTPVGPAEDSRVFVRMATGQGKPAVTEWRVLERGAGCCLVEARPRTGRRHQIRVHFETLGYPILGDLLYGRPDRDYLNLVSGHGDARVAAGEPTRTLLHCASMTLREPDGNEVTVRSTVPEAFAAALGGSGFSPAGPAGSPPSADRR